MKALLLTILFVSSAANAVIGHLHAIELRVPLDAGQVHKACSDAFQQALQDKMDYEARPEINFQCAAILPRDKLASIEESFMSQCANQLKGRADVSANGIASLDTSALQGEFNEAYGAYSRQVCLDGALRSYYSAQAQSKARPDAGGGAVHESHGRWAFSNGN